MSDEISAHSIAFLGYESVVESNVHRFEIRRLQDLKDVLGSVKNFRGWTLQNIDLTTVDFSGVDVDGLFLLGCCFASSHQKVDLIKRGAFVFPRISGLPYNPYRNKLYTTQELLEGWAGGYKHTKDFEIYEHFEEYSDDSKRAPIYLELAQRMHDHAIDSALADFIDKHEGRGIVGIMGGHAARRTDPSYTQVVEITWELKRRGYMIASGGGPGIMEAANLGAYLAKYANKEVLYEAVKMLEAIPSFSHARSETINAYIESAMEVVKRFKEPNEEDAAKYEFDESVCNRSLAVPTWFYGHEPTNLFSNYIAKYFANSIREDGLLAICSAGVVYAPGGAGTLQEVFIDLSQNHYALGNARSPMVFLSEEAFGQTYQLIEEFVRKHDKVEAYGDMIAIAETPREVVDFIEAHPKRMVGK